MRRYLILIITLMSLVACRKQQEATEKNRLQYHEDGSFKIVQFTDLHYIEGSPNSVVSDETIAQILEIEKPDVAILTGDQVIDHPSKDVWPRLAALFEKAKVPFGIVFGNHDAETITRDSVFEILSHSPYFIGEKGLGTIHGVGNYVLPVSSSASGKPALLLYCLDSNDYSTNRLKYGHYDWFHYDQIAWYRAQSEQFTARNNSQPVPALMFFHIPLHEYDRILGQSTTLGTKGEENGYGRINSGMFSSIVDMQDVMGVFAGHDHDNDFIGTFCNVALAYGRVTGADAYGKLERGARIIELNENKPFRFTTWIRTLKGDGVEHVYYYPSGISKVAEDTAVYLPALRVDAPKQQGVHYTYYEGNFRSVDQLASAAVVKQGSVSNFFINEAGRADHFGFDFHSWIKIPEKGIYYFYTFSDDGSRLWIDGKVVVENDGSHSARRVDGVVALEAGYHDLRVRYFENYMGECLEAGVQSKNIPETLIPDSLLYIPNHQ